MTRFDKNAREAGVAIDNTNGVAPGNRNLRSIRDLINAARAAESELNNKMDELRDELAAERLANRQLVAENAELKLELSECRLRQRVSEGDFTIPQRNHLLGVAAVS